MNLKKKSLLLLRRSLLQSQAELPEVNEATICVIATCQLVWYAQQKRRDSDETLSNKHHELQLFAFCLVLTTYFVSSFVIFFFANSSSLWVIQFPFYMLSCNFHYQSITLYRSGSFHLIECLRSAFCELFWFLLAIFNLSCT